MTAFDGTTDRFPLEKFAGERPPAPKWYIEAMRHAPEVSFTNVEGADIELLTWGEVGKPGILLVHGNFAHAYWWGPLGPLLGRHYRVCALSFSGMGRSGWRPAYNIDLQVAEIAAAAEAGGLFACDERPTLIAHSYGGEPALWTAARIGDRFSRAILLECGVNPVDQEGTIKPSVRTYPTMVDALSRFRLSPPQPEHHNLFILDEIGRQGLVQDDNGEWRWRFDPHFWNKLGPYNAWPALPQAKCPLTFLYGEESVLVDAAWAALQAEAAPKGTTFVPMVATGHHMMIDQPLAVLSAIQSTIEESRRNRG
ncbi:MAG TPA: alpha/beta hydrolase [Novosphingobium sp.]|nr:alpha/beta hydrolase [Novosphingobium sp.]